MSMLIMPCMWERVSVVALVSVIVWLTWWMQSQAVIEPEPRLWDHGMPRRANIGFMCDHTALPSHVS